MTQFAHSLLLVLLALNQTSPESDTATSTLLQEIGITQAELQLAESLTNIAGLIPDTIRDDPLLILGIYASDDQDRAKYARLYLTREQSRSQRELQFLRIYQQEFEKAAKNSEIFNVEIPTASTKSMAYPTHLVALVSITCDGCISLINAAMSQLARGTLSKIDIHFPESESEAQIRAWGQAAGLDTELVSSGNVTLNRGLLTDVIQQSDTFPALFWRDRDSLTELTISERLQLTGPP